MVMTLDPGISGTGYAIWDKDWNLIKFGNLHSPKYPKWELAANHLSELVEGLDYQNRISKTYIEFPAYFSSPGGEVTARSGSLVKLSVFIGILMGVLGVIDTFLLPVNEWKGQLPKKVVENRIRRILPKKITDTIKSHAWDAVGMGLYLKGDMR